MPEILYSIFTQVLKRFQNLGKKAWVRTVYTIFLEMHLTGYGYCKFVCWLSTCGE